MKIDKTNPSHIKALVVSAVNSIVVSVLRPFYRKKGGTKTIVFYGHTLNGNLRAFFNYLKREDGYRAYFLVLDKDYLNRLKKERGDLSELLYAGSLHDMIIVGRSDAIVTSHGLHLFSIIRYMTSIKFVDVWHAVSYKGFSVKSFRHLKSHDQLWVSSPDMKKLYVDRYEFSPTKVKVTGYGRTDLLLNGSIDRDSVIKRYNIPAASKYVLIAPTWKQDDKNRSVLPFDMKAAEFFEGLDKIAKENNTHIIFRTHLNSGDHIRTDRLKHTSFMPYGEYEVTEDFLYLADILVTDWSSIGIDYLPLKRPTIFLDVPVPFKHGFNLGPEHRYGDVVKNYNELTTKLSEYLNHPNLFLERHGNDIKKTTAISYGDTLDSGSLDRYFQCLKELLAKDS